MLARVMIGALVVLGFGQAAFAGCTCSLPGGGCGRGWSSGQVIFLGKVTADIETEAPVVEDSEEEAPGIFLEGSRKRPYMNHAVHISIAESFRGEGQQGQEIVVHTGVDERGPRDGDCGYPFVVGVNYLVYASGDGDSLSTSICTFTSPEVAVGGVLRELRAIRDGQPVDSLFGTVSLLSPRTGPWLVSLTRMRPLDDVSVRVTDSAGRVRSTKTDKRGVYAFEWLPPDSYRIEHDLPAGLTALSDGEDPVVDLTDKDATLVGCRADVRARSDVQISGAVVDSHARTYRVGIGDHLEIWVWQHSNFSKTVVVDLDGNISPPSISIVKAVSVNDLVELLSRKLQFVFPKPHVTVVVSRTNFLPQPSTRTPPPAPELQNECCIARNGG